MAEDKCPGCEVDLWFEDGGLLTWKCGSVGTPNGGFEQSDACRLLAARAAEVAALKHQQNIELGVARIGDELATEREERMKADAAVGLLNGEVERLEARLEAVRKDAINAVADVLHEQFGVCGHCGKSECRGRDKHSTLPSPWGDVLDRVRAAVEGKP